MKIKDYILNGQAHGSVGGMLMQSGFDIGTLRPFIGKRRKTYVTLSDGVKVRRDKKGRKHRIPQTRTAMLAQATGILMFDEWKQIDRTVRRAAQPQLQFFNDLRSANSIAIPNGLGTTVFESLMAGDITPAEVNMDGLAMADQDRPLMDMEGVPLPIIHKDFILPLRHIEVARKSGYPLNTRLPADAAVKVAEEAEKLAIGVGLSYQFAGKALYGMTNWPKRIPVELSDPTDVGWTPADLITDFIEMRTTSRDVGYNGPWRVYLGSGWDGLLDEDYSTLKGDHTLRERLLRIRGMSSIDTLDFMPKWDIVMIQMDPRVVAALIGMPLTTLQWEQQGGMEVRLKVMAIMVPFFMSDFYGNSGVIHGSVPGGVGGS